MQPLADYRKSDGWRRDLEETTPILAEPIRKGMQGIKSIADMVQGREAEVYSAIALPVKLAVGLYLVSKVPEYSQLPVGPREALALATAYLIAETGVSLGQSVIERRPVSLEAERFLRG